MSSHHGRNQIGRIELVGLASTGAKYIVRTAGIALFDISFGRNKPHSSFRPIPEEYT